MNAAALLVVGGKASDPVEGVRMARAGIASGRARQVFADFGAAVRDEMARLESPASP